MSIFKPKSIVLCSLISGLSALSGCSDNDPADVSFEQKDTTDVKANIIPNPDLSQSDSEWTGWSAEVDETDDAVAASFSLAPTLGEGGNSLQTSVTNIEVQAQPTDIYAGPASVTVKPGQAYGVAAYVQGPTCGLTRFVVNPVGNNDPDNYLARQNIYLTGEPQLVEFYFQVPAGVASVDMPVQMGFADNIGGEFFLDRMVAMPIPKLPRIGEGNVANNSDFEESNTSINVEDYWGQSGSGVTFSLNRDPAHVQSGNNSVEIVFDESVGAGDPWAIEAGPANVPVTSGWTYVFSGWVKGTPGAKANFLVQKPAANWDTYGQQEVIVTSEWQEVRFEAAVSGTDVVRLFTQYNFPENKGATIYIDNLKLIPPATCPYAGGASDGVSGNQSLFEYNHVVNSSLEEDPTVPLGWTTVAESGAAQFEMQVVLDDFNRTLVNKGNHALRTSITSAASNPADIQAGPSDIYVKPGHTYIYSGYARGAVGTRAQFTSSLPDAPSIPMEAALVTFNNIWQQITFDFTVPDNAPTLTAEELEEAGFPEDALVTRLNMTVNMGYPENEGKAIFLDDFVLLPNAVINGDLEDSLTMAEGWTTDSADDYATFNLDSDTAHTGGNSLSASFSLSTADTVTRPDDETGEDSDPPIFVISPEDVWAGVENIAVTEGRQYFASARVNGEAGSRLNLSATSVDGLLELASVGNEDENEDGIPDGIELAGGWEEITFTVSVPMGVDAVNMIAQMGYPTNVLRTIYLDSFRLVSEAPAVSNLVSDNPDLFEFNRVTNGGLEAEATQPAGWSTLATDVDQADFSISSVVANSGSNSLKTTITSVGASPSDIQVGPSDLFLVPGHTYTYSAFARGELGARAGFAAMLPDSESQLMEQLVDTLNYSWQQFTFDFTVPADAPVLTADELIAAGLPEDSVVSRVRMVVNMSYAENVGKRIYLDDFVLLPNAATNGDLEDSTVDATGWYTEAAGSTATFQLDSAESHTGNNSLRIEIGTVSSAGNLWDVQAGISDIPVAGGRTYYISTRIKGNAGTRAKVLLGAATSPYQEFASVGGTDGIAVTENWQEVTFEATIPAEGVEAVRLLAHLGFEENSNSVIYLDSFRVVSEVPRPPKANNANLVTNSGLESGTATGWNGNGATITVVNTADAVYSGSYGLHVTDRTATWASAQYDLTDAGLEPGSNYFASTWVKVDGDASDILGMTLQINYEGDGSDTDYVTIINSGNADTSDWTRLSRVFTFSPDEGKTVTGVRIYIEASQQATNYYIDDLFVTKVYNTNGGFETGDIAGWQAAGATVSAAMTDVHSGTYAAHVTERTANWNSAQYDMREIGLVPGRTYLISAWVKTDGATAENIKMTMEYVDAGESPQYRTLAQSSETLEWVQLSNTYTHVPEGDISTLKVYFEADSATGSYFIDDLIITEYVPPVSVITNGDLELGNTEGWVPSGATLSMANWPEGGAHSGFFGLRVADRTMNWNSAQYPLLELGLESGTSYQASVWVKIAGETVVSDTLSLTLLLNDGRANPYINVASATVTSDGWTQLIGTFDYVPTGDVSDFRLYIEAAGTTTSYFVDDLVVAPNFAVNGGLEVSSTAATGWNGAGATISLDTTTKRFGERSIFVSGRTENWNSAQFDLTTSGMERGKTYEISAWVKIEGDANDVIKMTLESRPAGDAASTYTLLDEASDTVNWVKLTTQYVFTYEQMPEVFKVYFEATLPASSYYVDALVITEVNEIYTH